MSASVAVGIGLAMGGWDFVRQHNIPLLVAAGILCACITLGLKLAAGILRGAVLAVRRPREMGQSGAAAAEFVIVVIPFLLMLLGIMQMALASMGRVLVSYAAFTAARMAIVAVPMEPKDTSSFKGKVGQAFTSELGNNIGYGANTRTDYAISAKAALIRNAAAYALIPASPSIDVVVQDTSRNWGTYLPNRLKYGLNPLDYLKSVIGDLSAIPSALVTDLGLQLQTAIQNSLDSPAAKKAATDKVDSWIASNIKDPKQAAQAKQAADNFISQYTGSAESATGQLGTLVQNELGNLLSGPLDKFKDQVNGAVDGALSGQGGGTGGPGGKGYAVDRALDYGFGSGTDGAGGAILRSLRKLVYARLGTVVTLLDEQGNVASHFEWNAPIKARVTYLFYCQIPLANRFAGHAFYNLPDSTVADLATGPLKGATILGIPGYFMTLTAEHTMVNQGKPD